MMTKSPLSDAKRELLARMLRGEGGAGAPPIPPIPPRAAGATIPLSADQRQVWLHAAMAPDVPLYNESITIHRFGPFDRAAMEQAVNALLQRHEAWRTSIALDGPEPVQIVHDDIVLALPFDDVSHLPAPERDAAALAIGSADARAAIDFTKAPLLRARIVRLGPEEHRLYLTLHHIIFDGVAIYRVIVPELAALYGAFAAGKPSPLPRPTLQYGDYALWQQAHLASPAVRRQLDHWRITLADAPAKLELPTDRPRPAVQTHAGSMENFHIPLELTEALKKLAHGRNATLYMTLLAGFTAMLHRYTGSADIVVGGVTDLRRRPELERVVGYFLNTIALRTRPDGGLPFGTHLERVRDTVLGALGASEVPFDEVVRDLGIRRTPGTHPLFNILFSVEPPVEPFPAGWDLTQMDVVIGGAKFDLYLELDERPDGMIGRFLYGTELFDVATIRSMIGHYLTLLEAAAADPGRAIADLPLLSEEDTARIAGWNDTARAVPSLPLPEAIEANARATPDAPAIVFEDRLLSYGELIAEADRIRARLMGAGLARGALVGVYLDRSPEMVAALIAILAAGAAYLPLDPRFPPARLDQIVEDAQPQMLLTQRALQGSLPTSPARVVVFDDGEAPGEPSPRRAIAPDDLAYVLYTSGSTGRPKGVEIDHRALANLLGSMRDTPGFAARDALLAVTTLSFDIAALELFLPLLCGGRLILAPSDTARDPDALAALIARERPTMMQATPTTWRALLETGWRGDPALTILCGGESLSRDLADRLMARAARLFNMYGPTETTIWSALAEIAPGTGPVPIGRPIANTATWVLDAHGALVPPGVVGELHIGGEGLARGYRGRPDLTAERFGETAALPGVRLYRTGDLARQDRDGTLYCLGRTDNDEKIRGYRIAVEEIEGALARHPGIAAAAVRSWPEESGERALAAYLVARDGELPIAALREHLGGLLPDYMVPARFVHVSALPLTPNGKVDRRALPEPGAGAAPAALIPPQGEAEERLAAIWRDLLGVTAIGRRDSFFDLGGHSLLVAKLLRRVEQDYGRVMTMAGFFRAHQLDAMARALAEDALADAGIAVPIQPNGWRPPLLWLEAGPTFRPLAEALGQDQPFFGVPIDLVLEQMGDGHSMPEIAREVVAMIRAIRPHGPYYIGGWCTAGILAYEVAAQLRAAGEAVPLLLLIHSVNPTEFGRIGWARLRASKLRFHAGELLRHGWAGTHYLRERLQGVLEDLRLSRARRAPGTHGALRAGLDRAAYAYQPPAYGGDVLLFEPRERPALPDARSSWVPVMRGRFTAELVTGGHSTMLQHPHVAQLATAMRAALVAAQSGR